MSGTDTNKLILDTALQLFSQRGFASVSIRDICGCVGIKESTIYYYFENKRAIFETLRAQFEAVAVGMMTRLEDALAQDGEIGFPTLNAISEGFFDGYLMDAFCNRFMRIMFIEQYHDGAMQSLYQKWMLDEPLRFQNGVFARLTGGKVDEYLAVKYYAPIFLYFQQYLLSGPLTEEKKCVFRQKAEKHMESFFKEWGVTSCPIS